MDRLDPFGALGVEILGLVQSAERFEPPEDVAHDRPFIEPGAALAADAAQGSGERWVAHLVAGNRRFAARQKQRRGDRIAQFRLVAIPVIGDALVHDITVFCGPRRRLQQFRKRPRAVFAVDRAPRIDRAGDCHGMRGLHLDVTDTVFDIPFDRRLARRAPRAV